MQSMLIQTHIFTTLTQLTHAKSKRKRFMFSFFGLLANQSRYNVLCNTSISNSINTIPISINSNTSLIF